MARADVKVVLLGSSGVGKTCLLERYVNDQFDTEPKNTIGAAFAAKKVSIKGGKSITLGVWDTAGAEQFQSLSRMYYCGAKIAVCCFDASKQPSFQKLQFWVSELREHEPQCRLWLCQTRSDLVADPEDSRSKGVVKRNVSHKAAQQFAASISAPLVVTSAKYGTGIQELFQAIAQSAVDEGLEISSPGQLSAISTRRPASPRSHSIVLSPDQSPTDCAESSGGAPFARRTPSATTRPSSCC